ncbi:hypothetical protein [Flavobacterium foetidum]|uniref:hypothetical protein n=1 Tax=Flavobacterium foetidum TaxID=2026681 RepID=UPI001074B195|nr:hypothetical protein [Flavobacterium foetidum]KAF2515964.1 hypothetical protein E0W73_06835 [Flavobacterium foetidum]
MDRLKNIALSALLISFGQVLTAQNFNTPTELNRIDKNLNESIYISTNAGSYLTGETLLYKIFCIDNSTQSTKTQSKTAYIQLVDSNKKSVFTHKIFLKDGAGNGDFFLPTTLQSGNYKLIGYTKWMLNKDAENFFNIDLYILNPYKEASNQPLVQNENTVSSPVPVTSSFISFDLKSKNYSNRQEVSLAVKSESDDFLNGKYSLSVRKTDGFAIQNRNGFAQTKDSRKDIVAASFKDNNLILPELRGELITGKITSSSADIKNKKVALSIVDKNSELKFTKTDDQGKFVFNLEKPNPSSNIIVQVVEDDKENYSIEVDQDPSVDFSKLQFANLQFNPDFANNITDRLVSSQIENAYYNVKKDSIINLKDSLPFFGNLSSEFVLDDYTRFKTMEETITEVIKGVYFTKTKNNYSIHIFDNDPNYESTLPALVAVDGLVIEDLNEFFAYNPKNIEKVNVVKGIYYYGAKSFNGLLIYTSKEGNFDTKLTGRFITRPQLLRPEIKKEYFHPDYSTNKNERIPDYRHQLLWNPDVNLKNQKLNFYTSDVSGQFEIILEGFSESGKPVFIKELITVTDNIVN